MIRRALMLATFVLVPAGAMAAPPGSYQRSCSDIGQSGSFLTATCRGVNGASFESSLDLRACRGQPVANNNGRLACGTTIGTATRSRGDGGDGGNGGDGGFRRPPPPAYGYARPPRPRPDEDAYAPPSQDGYGYQPRRRPQPRYDEQDD